MFSTELQAQFQSVPGSPLGAARVTWRLTHPGCIQVVCVKFENSNGDIVISNECLDDTTVTEMVIEGLPCNVRVKAVMELAAGGKGRSQSSNEIYIGGENMSLKSTMYILHYNYISAIFQVVIINTIVRIT